MHRWHIIIKYNNLCYWLSSEENVSFHAYCFYYLFLSIQHSHCGVSRHSIFCTYSAIHVLCFLNLFILYLLKKFLVIIALSIVLAIFRHSSFMWLQFQYLIMFEFSSLWHISFCPSLSSHYVAPFIPTLQCYWPVLDHLHIFSPVSNVILNCFSGIQFQIL